MDSGIVDDEEKEQLLHESDKGQIELDSLWEALEDELEHRGMLAANQEPTYNELCEERNR